MSSLECFVCHELVRGDAAYQEHHLNRCLDEQASGASAPSTSSNTASQSANGCASPSNDLQKQGSTSASTSNHTTSSDELLARALAEQIDAEAVATLSAADAQTSFTGVETGALHQWFDFDPQSIAAASSASPAGCPLCSLTWESLGVGAEQEEREQHAAYCLNDWGEQDNDEEDYVDQLAGKGKGKGKPWKRDPKRPTPKFDWAEAGKGQQAVKGTAGLVRVLHSLLERSHAEGKTKHAFLANERVEHIAQGGISERMWACGYRNAQMLFSALRHLDIYSSLNDPSPNLPPIPTILELQNIIELAWEKGHDPPGRDHFKGKLIGSCRWIGTTEVYTAMTWLGIRVKIIDFPKDRKSESGIHHTLVNWIQEYFETPLPTSPTGAKRPLSTTDGDEADGTETNALAALMASKGSAIKYTSKQPLYLQHEGHSRTVVGIEISRTGSWLLIFDPGLRVSMTLSAAAAAAAAARPSAAKTPNPPFKRSNTQTSPTDSSSFAGAVNALGLGTSAQGKPSAKDKSEAAFWDQTPGGAQMGGAKTGKKGVAGSGAAKGWATGSTTSAAAGAGKGAGGLDLQRYAKMLEPYRVSLSRLGRNAEYQVLYFEEGPPLTPLEIQERRTVKSTKMEAPKKKK